MDWLTFFSQLLPFLGAGIGFIYGAKKLFKKKIALYMQLIVCALGCLMLGRLFALVNLVAIGSIPRGFQVGLLGTFGCFLFLFSANFGQMDGLVDGREKEYRKYRLLSLLAPACILAIYLPVLFADCGLEIKIVTAVIVFPILEAAYYNLKHLIMPDVDMGILDSIRKYNFVALILSLVCAIDLTLSAFECQIGLLINAVIMAAVCLVLVPTLDRGAKKWTI
ncbi:MAG: hypothetical protein PHX51_03190 [Clostridia bacterium]|nr:hypothetical protein [Clostridia bacterium]